MRLLMITYHFPPDGHVGAVRPYELARLLPEHGVEPWILTVLPQYASHPDPTYVAQGIPPERIIRTTVLPSRRDKFLRSTRWVRRLLKSGRGGNKASQSAITIDEQLCPPRPSLKQCFIEWLGFPDWYSGWYKPAMRAVAYLMQGVRFDAVWSTSFPRTAQIIGYEVSRRYNLPWVADWRDPWLHYIEGWGDPVCPLILRRYEWMLIKHLKQASVVTTNSAKLCQFWQERMPQYAKKFRALPNGIPEELWAKEFAPTGTERFIILYLGSVYQRISPKPFFQGVRQWLDRRPCAKDKAELRFYGDMSRESILSQAESLGLAPFVHIGGRVDRGNVTALIQDSACLLILAQGLFLKIPAKTYEYLVSNKPIIAVAEPHSAVGVLLQDIPGCYVVNTPEEIASALDSLWQHFERGEPACAERRRHIEPLRYSNIAEGLATLVGRLRLEELC